MAHSNLVQPVQVHAFSASPPTKPTIAVRQPPPEAYTDLPTTEAGHRDFVIKAKPASAAWKDKNLYFSASDNNEGCSLSGNKDDATPWIFNPGGGGQIGRNTSDQPAADYMMVKKPEGHVAMVHQRDLAVYNATTDTYSEGEHGIRCGTSNSGEWNNTLTCQVLQKNFLGVPFWAENL